MKPTAQIYRRKICPGLLNTKAFSPALGIHQTVNHGKLGKYFWGNLSSA